MVTMDTTKFVQGALAGFAVALVQDYREYRKWRKENPGIKYAWGEVVIKCSVATVIGGLAGLGFGTPLGQDLVFALANPFKEGY